MSSSMKPKRIITDAQKLKRAEYNRRYHQSLTDDQKSKRREKDRQYKLRTRGQNDIQSKRKTAERNRAYRLRKKNARLSKFIHLPKHICVETQFVPHKILPGQVGMLPTMNLNGQANTSSDLTDYIVPSADEDSNELTVVTPPLAKPILKDACVLTETANPLRDRGTQAGVQTVHVEVQCELYKELKEQQIFGEVVIETEEEQAQTVRETNEATKKAFLEFVQAKSNTYSNGKRECCVCGEIKAHERKMLQHMSRHWGPAVLCWQCGLQFEHEKLLETHNCDIAPCHENKQLYKCPAYACHVSAMSLVELYDHINEHTAMRRYRCCSCRKRFSTAGELRHHKNLRLSCKKLLQNHKLPYINIKDRKERVYRSRLRVLYSLKGKKILAKSSLTQLKVNTLTGIGRCQICLLRCRNPHQMRRHYTHCLKTFITRLKNKRASCKT